MARSTPGVRFKAPLTTLTKATMPGQKSRCRFKKSRQAAFELPLNQNLIEQLALEASFHCFDNPGLIGKILKQAMERD
jgi:hypothetical protein